MTDNRIFSKDACTVCGRLGDPHAEWCYEMRTALADDAAKAKAHPIGEEVGNSKLTELQVRRIRARLKTGELQTELAIDFGVSPSTISFINTRRTWKHVA